MIEIKYLKQLLELFDQSTADDLRIEQDGASIRLSKRSKREEVPAAYPAYQYPPFPAPMHSGAPAPMPARGNGSPASTEAATAAVVEDTKKYHEIRSPIVGTFYRAPGPDSPSFVEVGQEVSPGQVLCIVEAMKLMNEIECDVYGRIVKILGENAQPVEYNQVLFLIDPS